MQPTLSLVVPLHIRDNTDSNEAIAALANEYEHEIEIIAIPVRAGNEEARTPTHATTVGAARNEGVALANGRYIAFGDDDPDVLRGFISRALEVAKMNDFDIALAKNGASAPLSINERIAPCDAGEFSTEVCSKLFQFTSPSPKYKLFKRELIESTGIAFQSVNCEETPLFTFGNLAEAKALRLFAPLDTPPTIPQPSFVNSLSANRCLIESLKSLHSFLGNAHALPSLLSTYQEATLRLICDRLKALRDDSVRCSILDDMNESDYLTACQLCSQELATDEQAIIGRADILKNALDQRAAETSSEIRGQCEIVFDHRSEDHPMVSVVMPVYNAMPYLTETIASLTRQTLASLEIICINDGSTDGSLDELLRVASQDKRIVVLTQNNCGQSGARNHGLEQVRGNFCYFMDSDDCIEHDTFATLVDRMEKDSLDLLCFDARPMYENEELEKEFPGFKHSYERHKCYSGVLSGPEMLRQLEIDGAYFQSPCLYLSRTSYLENISACFIEGIAHEDNAFTFKCFLKANRISHINHAFFYRRVRPGSIMTSTVRFARPYGYFSCFNAMLRDYTQMEGVIPPEARGSIQRIIFTVLASARNSYTKMTPEDYGRELGLQFSYQPFTIAVIRPAEFSMELSKTRVQEKKARNELKKVRQSRSFKLGKALMTPFTKLKKLAKGQRKPVA